MLTIFTPLFVFFLRRIQTVLDTPVLPSAHHLSPWWALLDCSPCICPSRWLQFIYLKTKKQQQPKRSLNILIWTTEEDRGESWYNSPIWSSQLIHIKEIWKEKSNSSKVKQQPSATALQFDWLPRTTTNLFFPPLWSQFGHSARYLFFASFNLFHSIWGPSCKL